MQMFHELIFDEMLPGNSPTWAGFQWGDLLGSPDSLVVTAVVTGVSAGGLTLTAAYSETPDGDVHENAVKTIISAGALSTTAETILRGSYSASDPNFPPAAGAVLIITLNGAGTAQVRVWITGRGQRPVQLRQAGMKGPAEALQLVRSLVDQTAGTGGRVQPAGYIDPQSLFS